jgi:hypothetical protein
MRATVLTYTITAVCLLAGSNAAWRTRSMRAGVVTSLSAATMGALFSIVGTGLMLAVWHDPATPDAWRSGGLDEAFIDVPLKVIALGGAMGTLGAVLGKGYKSIRGPTQHRALRARDCARLDRETGVYFRLRRSDLQVGSA